MWALAPRPLAHRACRRGARRACSSRAPCAIEAFHSVQVALSALDRLEVRGRDSAGLHVLVTGHGLDLADPTIAPARSRRAAPIRCSRRARCASPTATSRSSTRPRPRSVSSATTPRACATQIRDDELLRLAVAGRHAPRPWCSRTHAGRASASSPRRTRTRSTRRSSDARRRAAYVVGRAQRRRRQLRRPQGARGAAASRPRSRPTPR